MRENEGKFHRHRHEPAHCIKLHRRCNGDIHSSCKTWWRPFCSFATIRCTGRIKGMFLSITTHPYQWHGVVQNLGATFYANSSLHVRIMYIGLRLVASLNTGMVSLWGTPLWCVRLWTTAWSTGREVQSILYFFLFFRDVWISLSRTLLYSSCKSHLQLFQKEVEKCLIQRS
jgi:hypothetical protein